MSKKQKRQVSQPTSTAAPVAQVVKPVRASRANASEDFNPDYTYVIQDLKRIGIMAGSFILVLVVLSFFLG